MASILDEFLILFKPTIDGDGFQRLNSKLSTTFTNLMSIKNLLQTTTTEGFFRLNKSAKSATNGLENFKNAARELNGHLKVTRGNLSRVRTAMSGMRGFAGKMRGQGGDGLFSPRNLIAGFLGYDVYTGTKEILGSVINATREMGAMRSRFYAITGDMGKANEQLQWAFDLAKRTAMPMKQLADSYSIFYAATAKGLGDTGAQQVFQDWTEVSRVLHMSTYQFERVTYALREMASKGVVYSQDLRMQIGTHVPNAVGLAEKAVNDLGITGTDWFEKFQKQSKGNQKMINQFLLLFSKYAKEMFANPEALAKAMQQPDAQIVRLQQQWDKLRYAMVDSGFTDDLLNILLHVNNLLDKITGHAKGLYEIIKDIIKILFPILALAGFRKLFKSLYKGYVIFKALKAGKLFKQVFGFSDKFAKTASKLYKGQGLKFLLKFLGGQAVKRFFSLGAKGLISLIPLIGQVAAGIWLTWDALSFGWDLLKLFFPNIVQQMTMLKLYLYSFGNWIKGWFINLFTFIPDYVSKIWGDFFSKLFGTAKSYPAQVAFPRGSWDNIYKQASITPLANYGMSKSPATNNIAVNNQITIDATGLTPEQAANMIADAQAQNNQNVQKQIAMELGMSKMWGA